VNEGNLEILEERTNKGRTETKERFLRCRQRGPDGGKKRCLPGGNTIESLGGKGGTVALKEKRVPGRRNRKKNLSF